MAKTWLILLAIFVFIVLVLWKITSGPMKKEYGEKMWRQGASRLSYWQFIIYLSGGLSFLCIWILKTANIISF